MKREVNALIHFGVQLCQLQWFMLCKVTDTVGPKAGNIWVFKFHFFNPSIICRIYFWNFWIVLIIGFSASSFFLLLLKSYACFTAMQDNLCHISYVSYAYVILDNLSTNMIKFYVKVGCSIMCMMQSVYSMCLFVYLLVQEWIYMFDFCWY